MVGLRFIIVLVISMQTGGLMAQDRIGALDTSFGHALSLAGDVLAIGAPEYDQGRGGFWIYERAGANWQLVFHASGASGDSLGYSLALNDTLLLAGAPGANTACLYARIRNSWEKQTCLHASRDGFGHSVAVRGIFAAVGSPYDDRTRGAVDLFIRTGSTTWSHQSSLYGESEHDAFGTAVALNLETMLVGAPLADEPRGRDAGLVYVYNRTGGSDWVLEAVLMGGNAGFKHGFGQAVAMSATDERTHAVIGAPQARISYLFARMDDIWQQADVFRPVPPAPWQSSGVSVDLNQDIAIIGSPSVVTGQSGSSWILQIDEYNNWYTIRHLQGESTFGTAVKTNGNHVVVSAVGAAVYGYNRMVLLSLEPTKTPVYFTGYPNPFSDHITFAIDQSVSPVAYIKILDLAGRHVITLETGGRNSIVWHPHRLATGIYTAIAKGDVFHIVHIP